MATPVEIEATYDYQDEICRLSLGPMPSITCAMYDGEFNKSLEQAQADKNRYILEMLKFQPKDRILDIGCGWGAVLNAVRDRGGRGVGITLSPKQASACRREGLEVALLDWNDLKPATFGTFDGLVSLGAFEHFCSPESFRRGEQLEIYRRFFKLCSSLIPRNRHLFLQSMIWGKTVPDWEKINGRPAKDSDAYILAKLAAYYPGSWLPNSLGQVVAAASPCFRLVANKNGRLDYIETLDQFRRRVWRLSLKKALYVAALVPRYIRDARFRFAIHSFIGGYNRECFVREIMTHERMVFEKV